LNWLHEKLRNWFLEQKIGGNYITSFIRTITGIIQVITYICCFCKKKSIVDSFLFEFERYKIEKIAMLRINFFM